MALGVTPLGSRRSRLVYREVWTVKQRSPKPILLLYCLELEWQLQKFLSSGKRVWGFIHQVAVFGYGLLPKRVCDFGQGFSPSWKNPGLGLRWERPLCSWCDSIPGRWYLFFQILIPYICFVGNCLRFFSAVLNRSVYWNHPCFFSATKEITQHFTFSIVIFT